MAVDDQIEQELLKKTAIQASHLNLSDIGTLTHTELEAEIVVKNVAITGATKTKITYDAKGLVTAGTDATTADIADSADKRYVTDAELTKLANVPEIKQVISLAGQIVAIGATAITGTNTAGLYRVSYSLLDTTADVTAGTIMVNFAGTDEAGVFTLSSVALPLTALGRTQGSLFLRISGTGSVSYSTTLVGSIGTSQYGLFISAEKVL